MEAFILVYEAGPDPVPADRIAENRAAWRAWNSELGELYGIRTASGAVVSGGSVEPYGGAIRGASMIEAESFEAAVALAQRAPNVAFGGRVLVLSEHEANR